MDDSFERLGINLEPEKQKIVPYEQSQQLAGELVHKYHDQMYQEDDAVKVPYAEKFFQHPRDFLQLVPEKILNKYMAHGNKKEFSSIDQLSDTLDALANSRIKGGWYSFLSGLRKGNQFGAYVTEIMIILNRDNPEPGIIRDKQTGVLISDVNFPTPPAMSPTNKVEYRKVNIEAVIFGEKFYPMLAEIQEMYPTVKILRADQVPEYFNPTK